MKALDYLKFIELKTHAIPVPTSDGNTVWTFPAEFQANEMSTALYAMGITGSTGQPKHVAQHIRSHAAYGVILTPNNLTAISKIQTEVETSMQSFNAKELAENIKKNFAGRTEWALGRYTRNASHAISNLIHALENYAEHANLNAAIKVTASPAHLGNSGSVAETFAQTLNLTLHGNIQETLKFIRADREKPNPALADALEATIAAIEKHFGNEVSARSRLVA